MPIGCPLQRKTQASSHRPCNCGQHLPVTPTRGFVSLIRSYAFLKSPLAAASFIPLTSKRTGHASIHTGVPHSRQRSASLMTSSSVYGCCTSEKLFILSSESDLRNGKVPTRLGSI